MIEPPALAAPTAVCDAIYYREESDLWYVVLELVGPHNGGCAILKGGALFARAFEKGKRYRLTVEPCVEDP